MERAKYIVRGLVLCVRPTLFVLSLFVITLLLSLQFGQWYFSNAVDRHLIRAYTENPSSPDLEKNIRNSPVSYGDNSNGVPSDETLKDALYDVISNGAQYGVTSNGAQPGETSSDATYGETSSDVTYGETSSDVTYGETSSDVTYGETSSDVTYGETSRHGTDFESSSDVTYGETSSDVTYGESSSDVTCGETSSDVTYGETSSDVTYGETSSDGTYGERSSDNTYGETSSDNTYGETSSDNTYGETSSDNTYGETSSDNTYGETSSDNTYGETSSDNTYGETSSDNTYGETSSDNTYGETSSDNTYGETSSDNTYGEMSSDNTYGETSSDNTYGETSSDNTYGEMSSDNTYGETSSDNTYGEMSSDNTYSETSSDATYGETSNGAYGVTSNDAMPSVCEFPNVNPYEPSVMKIAGLNQETMNCEETFKPDLTYITEGYELRVNIGKVEDYFNISDFQHCRYQHIIRNGTDDNSFLYSEWSTPFKDKVDLPEDAEFLKVECTNKESEVISKSFFCLIPKHEEFEEADYLNFKKRQVMSGPKETLNIIMIGMDTLPRNQFLRGCNKTYSYLMNSLNSFDLTMHSQLGENTFPNFLPLFGGKSYREVKQWWSDEYYMDTFDLMWATFEKAGYQTLYTEDWPRIGAFNYLKKGFRNPFARYNTRPFTLAMSDDEDIWEYDPYCAGNQLEMMILLDYVSRFLDIFVDKPVFVVAMLGKPTHDQPTDAKMFDEHLLNFYQSLNDSGHLNRSLLVSFSDHGVRWGPLRNSKNGVFESRTPYTILTFPDWFLRKYPDVVANLKANTRRLTSHFDTHATLLDLLYFKSDTPPPLAPLRHGISLFKKIPWDRTCVDASIPEEYCLCGYKSLEELNVTSKISKTLANLVIDAVNSKTDKKICSVFKLRKVIRILKVTLSETKSIGKTLYKVKLEATPGEAEFEANVYTEKTSGDFVVENEIHRLSLYRGQADCMNIAVLRPFCYCKNLLSGWFST